MKAPDKICVAPHQIFDYDLDIQEVGHNGAEDYIRKDALLEWAKEAHDSGPIKDSADKGDAWSIGYLCGMADLINRLKTL